jgi:hypothetical protein
MRIALISLLLAATLVAAPKPKLPRGFKPLFNGRDISNWHVSESNHHGNTKAWKVEADGTITVTQDQPGNGGILLTNETYQDFELSIEIKPDYGCDGGIFLRSTEKGEAYQVMLDYLDKGNVGGIYGERLADLRKEGVGKGKMMDPDYLKYWKKEDWNHLRIRIEGEAPHIQVWMNGTQIVDWTDLSNHAKAEPGKGMIALQVHRSTPNSTTSRWNPGGQHRYRNIGIKVLKP